MASVETSAVNAGGPAVADPKNVDVEAMHALERYVNAAFSHEIPLESDNEDSPTPDVTDSRHVQLRTNSGSLWRTRSNLPSFMATDKHHWIKYCGWVTLCVVAGILVMVVLFAAGGINGDGAGGENQQITWPRKNARVVILDVAGLEEPMYGQCPFENATNVSSSFQKNVDKLFRLPIQLV